MNTITQPTRQQKLLRVRDSLYAVQDNIERFNELYKKLQLACDRYLALLRKLSDASVGNALQGSPDWEVRHKKYLLRMARLQKRERRERKRLVVRIEEVNASFPNVSK